MKKTWIKRSEIYHKPFYRQKFKMLLLMLFLLGIIITIYNIMSINEFERTSQARASYISKQTTDNQPMNQANEADPSVQSEEAFTIMRGIRLFDYDAYKPNYEGNFKCLDGKQEIPFNRVNDDYCDCNDGTDEPSTNACNNGKFYCKFQKRHLTGRGQDLFVPSSRINDGVCDCCDGSDEWILPVCKTSCL